MQPTDDFENCIRCGGRSIAV